ncbi:MAG: hypothetical protein AAF329_21895 [Cyanobacteria bacterium P01_A01_bin.17]
MFDLQGECRLFSLGEDGVVQDFDLEASGRDAEIVLKSSFAISHPSVPTSFFIATERKGAFVEKMQGSPTPETLEKVSKPVLWVCNSDNKLRLIDMEQQQICETVRTPCSNGPIKSMSLFSVAEDSTCQCIAFTTGQSVVGISKFLLNTPFDNYAEFIAHSDSIASISVAQSSEQNQNGFLVTSGRLVPFLLPLQKQKLIANAHLDNRS